ncbi:MAG: FAD-dependent thymidylate synthase [Patescibacteria group bacterium]
MKLIEPRVFLVGETKVLQDEVQVYLNEIGAPDWESDAPTDIEMLVELMGRLCYRSFKPGLNPNVTKVREHNDEYLGNILETGHGSVLEHSSLSFIFMNVSRVLTHELVRHRIGVAISQESLRYVRLDKLNFWFPAVFRGHPKHGELLDLCTKKIEQDEQFQLQLAEILEIEQEKKFTIKKKITSAMRRFAPIGLATTIGWSVNMRALRHVIEMRTDPSAEEEIRFVFGKVAEIVKKRYPNIFGDYEIEIVDGFPWYKTLNRKV